MKKASSRQAVQQDSYEVSLSMDSQPMSVPPRIGPYRIVRRLGEGGMGAVFEAVHEAIERRVAIKILHSALAKEPEFTIRFFNEARAVNRVDHAGLVQVSDYGQLEDGTGYLIMELLRGETLGMRLKRLGGPLAVDQAVHLARQIADSLAAAHDRAVIHRDLKPENVMLIDDPAVPGRERTKLLDFGIAKLVDAANLEAIKTHTNALMGTPFYMSPEQCRGACLVDDRSDVYSLGVLLFVMLCGRHPFAGEGTGEIMAKHIYELPPPLASVAPWVSAELAALVHKLLAKDKQLRPSMRQVVAALDALGVAAEIEPVRSQQRGRATGREPSVLAISGSASLPPHSLGARSTLGRSTWQFIPQRRARWLIGAAAACGVAAFPLIVFQRQERSVLAAAPRPAPSRAAVRWRVSTTPQGAQVIRLSDGVVLGVTPWMQERPAETGELLLGLRLAGYKEQSLRLNEGADEDIQRSLDMLPRIPAPGPTPAPRRSAAERSRAKAAVPVNPVSKPAPAPIPAPAPAVQTLQRTYED